MRAKDRLSERRGGVPRSHEIIHLAKRSQCQIRDRLRAERCLAHQLSFVLGTTRNQEQCPQPIGSRPIPARTPVFFWITSLRKICRTYDRLRRKSWPDYEISFSRRCKRQRSVASIFVRSTGFSAQHKCPGRFQQERHVMRRKWRPQPQTRGAHTARANVEWPRITAARQNDAYSGDGFAVAEPAGHREGGVMRVKCHATIVRLSTAPTAGNVDTPSDLAPM